MGNLVSEAVASQNLSNDKALGVGIGIPALVTTDNQTMFYGEFINITGATCSEFSKYIPYDRTAARALTACLKKYPGLVFEWHSTDHQPKKCLREMVEDGIAILKVGPALTFALREGLFALEPIEQEIHGMNDFPISGFRDTLERVMLEDNSQWVKYYHGPMTQNRYARAYSFSDRARYYFGNVEVDKALHAPLDNLDKVGIPQALLSQYLPLQYQRVHAGMLPNKAADVLIDHVGDCIDDYLYAVLEG